MDADDLAARAARHAALGDPVRLAVVDALVCCDRSPVELRSRLGIGSGLLTHHLDVLEAAGLVVRTPSAGDRRRRYVQLRRDALEGLLPVAEVAGCEVLFVCTRNSARSQLAAAVWADVVGRPAASAGTRPAEAVDPGAAAAARRAGLDLAGARPCCMAEAGRADLVVTVCDQANEELGGPDRTSRDGAGRGGHGGGAAGLGAADRLHWSIPDPVDGGEAAYDAVLDELRERIVALVGGGRR